MVDCDAYRKLVDKVCKQKSTFSDDIFCWCSDCKEINLWTYWQGKDCKDVKIMVVGQDWGNPCLEKNNLTMENIRAKRNYFFNQNDLSKTKYVTDRSLCELFDSIGYKNIIENKYDNLFFTNFFLGYRGGNKKETGGMKRTTMMQDAKYFEELVSVIKPQVIICLGMLTYECVVDSLKQKEKLRIKSLRDYCDKIDDGTNYVDIPEKEVRVYGMIHCGASGVNINRKQGSKTPKEMSGLDLMKQDWKNVLEYLKDNKIDLNFEPMK